MARRRTTHDDRNSQLVTSWMPQGRSATRSKCVSGYQSLNETDAIIWLFRIYRLLIGKKRCVISDRANTMCETLLKLQETILVNTCRCVWRIFNIIQKYTRTQLFSHKTTAYVFIKLLHVSTRSVFLIRLIKMCKRRLVIYHYPYHCMGWNLILMLRKVKVKLTLEQATKAQRESIGIVLLF